MWNGPDPDPGGSSKQVPPKTYSSQELSDLRDQNEQQLVLIAQLKEMLRKEQSNVPQEKVEEYVNTLGRRTKRGKVKKDSTSSSTQSSGANIDSNKKEKVNLLRQQLEENKAKLAERGKSQKGIEEMVTQLQAKINESQISITPLSSAVDLKTINYTKNTSPEELYNILLTKEKRITELVNKVQKLEGSVLDLQENVKEKDLVIDARTKAITLMTDSLSKKGKNTLDALEDTKEQMRKMQENFIKLEADMKARQVGLLNDLKIKNNQISDLEEEKMSLKKLLEEGSSQTDSDEALIFRKRLEESKMENEHYLTNISELEQELTKGKEQNSELEKKLEEATIELKLLKNVGTAVEASLKEECEEISKLKKQLDESNKNMIKVKAQHKNKTKELNKKIDQLKKSGEGNTVIEELQAENTKLSQKVAELEEELGNIQLKMVDSTSSSNGSSKLEETIKELEETISKKNEEIDEKDKVITLLESEILSLKEEINGQKDKIENLSCLEVQVSSEMSSINYEEQLDKLEQEKKALLEEKQNEIKENELLLEKIENLKKEKHELGAKLDTYIQENMELIDKLEKLSAEKVSSAESIEIVEGLTQQEKIELAAYQKHIDVTIEECEHKCTEEDNLETPAELNESVMQLSEDTAELLQKIDMFTQERKEVMQKMEALREENNTLSLKVKEIENNRDVLAETYEQLQNEKEDLQCKLENIEKSSGDSEGIAALQQKYEGILKENEELKRTLKNFETILHEKDGLDDALKVSQRKCEDLESTIQSNLEEIENYKIVIEENKNELINSSSAINALQGQLTHRESDIQELNEMIENLNQIVNEQNKDEIVDMLEKQLIELKTGLSSQLEQAQEYESELNQNSDTIKQLNLELVEMNRRIMENETELQSKASELKAKEDLIENLKRAIQEKDKNFNSVNEEIREKYITLQKQLENNSGSLQGKVDELSNKNKEQLEKMKKIAANLKKKSHQYQELENKYKSEKEKWETESREKDSVIDQLNEQLSRALQQLKELVDEINLKNSQLEASARQIKTLSDQLQDATQSSQDLLNTIQEFKRKEAKAQEVSLQQELSTSLHEDFDSQVVSVDMKEEKVRELEMVIETNEHEIQNYKDRISRLESDLNRTEEEKNHFARKNNELEEKLSLTSNSFKEKAMLEDQLELKLAEISATDDILNKKLYETGKENEELSKKNTENEELIKKLKIKLKKAHDKVNELKNIQTEFKELESLNEDLKKQVLTLETSQRQIQTENESLQKRNLSDYEKIEADYQIQLEELTKVKNDLSVECEKLQDKINELLAKEDELQLEIEEYKVKLNQNEQQINDLTFEVDNLTVNNKRLECRANEVTLLQQQVTELQNELLLTTARSTVEDVIEEAVLNLTSVGCQTENIKEAIPFVPPVINSVELPVEIPIEEAQEFGSIPTFHWPGQEGANNERSQIISQAQVQEPVAEISGQQKISWSNDSKVPPTTGWFGNSSEPSQNQAEWLNKPQISQFSDWFDKSQTNQPGDWISQQQPTIQVVPQSHEQTSFVVENSKEALLNKIKALEFLLFNMDKEKEIALSECTNMINELSQIIYEKVNEPVTQTTTHLSTAAPLATLESQIVSEKDVTNVSDTESLRALEFNKTHPSLGQQSQPVVEDVIEPKTAYLTYSEDKEKVQKQLSDLSRQLSSKIQELENANRLLSECQNNCHKAEEGNIILKNQLEEKHIELNKRQQELQSHFEQIIVDKDTNIQQLLADVKDLEEKLSVQSSIVMDQNKKLELLQETIEQQRKKLEELQKQQLDEQMRPVLQADVASQVMSDQDIAEASNRKILQGIEFSKTQPSLGELSHPVVEEVPKPKHAYLTYSEEKPQSFEAFEENDDGWGWGPEEARLEEEHIQKTESTPQVQNLRQQIEHLQEQLRVLQVEREHHLEEIKQLQVKSGKLIKKCKELKTQNDHLTKRSGSGDDNFFNLDETIQEELKSQVGQLEKKLGEVTEELNKEKQEKNNILKRVDVLSSANERMVEMKEIQDSEVLRWQRKYNEAVDKLQQYEWGNDGFGEKPPQKEESFVQGSDDSKKIEELERTISELSVDNEELQALLEEQRKLRIEAENSSKNVKTEENLEPKVFELECEVAKLGKQIDEQGSQNILVHKLEDTIKQLQNILQQKEEQLNQLQNLALEKDSIISSLREEFSSRTDIESNLQLKIENFEKLLQEKEIVINDLQDDFDQLNNKKVELDQYINQLNTELSQQKAYVEEINAKTQQNNLNTVEKLEQEILNLTTSLQEKEYTIKEFSVQVDELSNCRSALETEIAELKSILNQKNQEVGNLRTQILELETSLQKKEKEFEEKLSHTVAEVTADWETQVDQRGADVAESWKLHLESVEREFASIQYKLREDISELEEKCNALVNENNELRKNVDAEIRNEVDRISALQQQITNNQQVIASLNTALDQKQREIESFSNTTNELEQLKMELAEKENKLTNINIVIETTQKQFDEKREVVEEIVRILEKNTSWPVSYEKQDVLSEFERQLSIAQDKEKEVLRLNQVINDLQTQVNLLAQKDAEIDRLGHSIDDFQKRLNTVVEKDEEIRKLNEVIDDLQKQLHIINEKDLEIIRLNALIEEYKTGQTSAALELHRIQQEHLNCSLVLQDYQQQLLGWQQSYEILNQSLEQKNQQVTSLVSQLQQVEGNQIDNNKEVDTLQSQIAQTKKDCETLQHSLSEAQTQLFNVTNQLTEKNQELDMVQQQLNYSQQNYQLSQEQIRKLSQEVQQKELEYNSSVENLKQNQLQDLEHHYEELLSAKELDVQTLRAQLSELFEHNKACTEKLNAELSYKQQLEAQVNDLQQKLSEQTTLSNEEHKQITELGQIIEDQVLKIEELKKELFEKSNQYDSLIAEIDISRKAITQQPSPSIATPQPFPEKPPEKVDMSEPASRAELDLALYMLHQRDVKCEELTVELTHLLEERDTLQLRLSNAIREKEDLRKRVECTQDIATVAGPSSSTSSPSKASEIFLAASGTELAKDPLEADQLATKLSELKRVGYKRDKTFVDEQQIRNLQQMSIMQQHIHEVSKLPPEAAAKLVDASYTLSRDVQSPSKVLLNWLWGRSTPKVDDT